jgi:hypothetical protein
MGLWYRLLSIVIVWIAPKLRTMTKKRKILLTVLGSALVIALSPYLYLSGSMAYDSLREHLHRIPFNSVAWQDEKQIESDDPIRIRMVDDLIRSRRLGGLKRADVEHILGKPNSTGYFEGHDFAYWLGPSRRMLSIDSEWLLIDFDNNGTVKSYSIRRD